MMTIARFTHDSYVNGWDGTGRNPVSALFSLNGLVMRSIGELGSVGFRSSVVIRLMCEKESVIDLPIDGSGRQFEDSNHEHCLVRHRNPGTPR
jgi:hypothetical protein